MVYIVDMVYTVNMVYTADMVYTAVRSEGAEGTKEGEVADGTDLAATYCHMVITPWDRAICLYGASEQNV